MLHLSRSGYKKRRLLNSIFLVGLGLFIVGARAQDLDASTPPVDIPAQETDAASGQLPSEQQSDAPPECTQLSQGRLDVALAKSSRVDNDLFRGLDGKTIRKIDFKAIDVFDEENPKENNKLYLLLNALHSTTHTHVVSSQLLFNIGDKIDVKVIQESERILRTRKYFTNAYIVPESVCGDQVDLLVVTQDAWVLEPQFSFSHKTGNTQSGFGISDGNILGTGNAFAVTYSENEQRNGVGYEFINPHFLNKKIAVRAQYEDTSDGRNSLLDISRPFYSLDTPWAAGIDLEDVSLIDTIFSRGESINEFRHQSLLNEIFFGKATKVKSNYTERWLVGFTNEEEKFFATPETVQGLPRDDKAAYPWVEYQYLENRFGVFKNLNQIQRPEDIALGQNFSFRFGFGGKRFDNPDDVVRFKVNYSNVVDIDGNKIFEYEVTVNGRKHLQISELDPVIVTTHMSYNFFEDEKNRWYSRIDYDVGQNLAQYQELTVGGITGLRGYPVDYSRGTKRYVFTLERRYFSDIHIFNLLRVGGVVFFDMGKAWGLEDQPYSPLLTNVGIGLRFSSTKIRVGNVVHIDIGMPTSAKSGISEYQLTIGAESKF